MLAQVEAPTSATQLAQVVVVAVVAIAANGVLGFVLQKLTRRAVRQAIEGKGRWRPRLPRTPETGQLQSRRMQRADATAKMVTRVMTLLIGGIAALTISHILGFDPLVLISSAGFVGAAIAIGGQSVIKDWLTGLMVLVEDRYADGDKVILSVNANPVSGQVESVNSTSVRIQLEDGSMWHAGHGSVESVNNLSQRSASPQPEKAESREP